jgi:hypothetical protein
MQPRGLACVVSGHGEHLAISCGQKRQFRALFQNTVQNTE